MKSLRLTRKSLIEAFVVVSHEGKRKIRLIMTHGRFSIKLKYRFVLVLVVAVFALLHRYLAAQIVVATPGENALLVRFDLTFRRELLQGFDSYTVLRKTERMVTFLDGVPC